MEKYNGWTNYATWRVNLELVDGLTPDSLGLTLEEWVAMEPYDQKTLLWETFDAYIEDWQGPEWVANYARAFMADVNWYEIARHLTDDWSDEK